MPDDQLYELARKRVNQRNRQILYLGINILAMFVYLGAFAALGDMIPRGIGTFIAIAWIGVIGFHAMMMGVMQSRKGAIDSEVARLREAVYAEKPKRLELDEDGELVDDEYLSADKRKQDSV